MVAYVPLTDYDTFKKFSEIVLSLEGEGLRELHLLTDKRFINKTYVISENSACLVTLLIWLRVIFHIGQ